MFNVDYKNEAFVWDTQPTNQLVSLLMKRQQFARGSDIMILFDPF